jgi:citrate synthase
MEPISNIDAKKGILYFRGHPVDKLVSNHSYEDILYLLVHGSLGSREQIDDLSKNLRSKRSLLKQSIPTGSPGNLVSAVRGQQTNQLERLLALVACAPLVVAIRYREQQGMEAIDQRQDLGHSGNLLWMLTGTEPSTQDLKDFETCLILHMDDPDNPSLTALIHALEEGEVVNEAFAVALEEHKSPLHHGAGTRAAKMILDLRDTDDVEGEVRRAIEQGEKLYGLGHRIYRTIDPRARILQDMLRRRTRDTEKEWLPEHIKNVAEAGARALESEKGVQIYPNVDLYNAFVYSTFNLPIDINTDLFAVSRVAGWMAHALEFIDAHTEEKTFDLDSI